MCLLLIAIDVVPQTPLLLLGNRDEFHRRESAPAGPWNEDARVDGGRDLVAGGSWLAVHSDARFAAVTNLRTGVPATAPKSRGWLVRDVVLGHLPPEAYLEALRADAASYGPFNLVIGDRRGVWAFGSAGAMPHRLGAGVHVVSNGPIGVHWPKTERLRECFADALAGGAISETRLLALLTDATQPLDERLPDTGVGIELERILAPIFIRGESYGTRASTLALRRENGDTVLIERRYGPGGATLGESRWHAASGSGFVAA